jgi:hypothetical protein
MRRVDDDLRDARLELPQALDHALLLLLVAVPAVAAHVQVVEHREPGLPDPLEERTRDRLSTGPLLARLRAMAAHGHDGEVHLDADLHQPLVERGRRGERPHVRVEVCDRDTHPPGQRDLCPNLALDLVCRCVQHDVAHLPVQVALPVDESRHLLGAGEWSPPVDVPFRRERQVQAVVDVWMFAQIRGIVGHPGTGHHRAGGVDQSVLHRRDRADVHVPMHAEIVCVKDDDAIPGAPAETFGIGSLRGGRLLACSQHGHETDERQQDAAGQAHPGREHDARSAHVRRHSFVAWP